MRARPRLFTAALLGALAPVAAARAQAARTVAPLTVWAADGRVRRVPLLAAPNADGAGWFVRADELALAVGSGVSSTGARVRFLVAGAPVDVAEGVPFARVGDREVPLADAPVDDEGGALLLPWQFVVDVLPRTVPGVRFDGAVRGLVVERAATLGSVVRSGGASSAAAVGSLSARTSSDAAPAAAAVRLPAGVRRTVVVDAGHGGPDAGMRGTYVGGPLTEKEVTLGIARAVRAALTERGVDVVMTRDRDTLIALADRGRIANARRGDLFVSIHVNAANPGWRAPTAARGFETYFLSDARTEDARQVAARENESVRFEAPSGPSAGGDPLRFVMSDLAQNAHLRGSSRLAAAVQRRLGRVHPGPGRGVHQAGFKVLVTASMPAVLVETGFGSNGQDAAYLMSDDGRRDIAAAIADAAVEYLVRYGDPAGRRPAPEAATSGREPSP